MLIWRGVNVSCQREVELQGAKESGQTGGDFTDGTSLEDEENVLKLLGPWFQNFTHLPWIIKVFTLSEW